MGRTLHSDSYFTSSTINETGYQRKIKLNGLKFVVERSRKKLKGNQRAPSRRAGRRGGTTTHPEKRATRTAPTEQEQQQEHQATNPAPADDQEAPDQAGGREPEKPIEFKSLNKNFIYQNK